MKPVYQTKFGGLSAPPSEQGNCLQACLASLLEIPLEEAFDVRPYDDGCWAGPLNKWLAQFGLHFMSVLYNPEFEYPGYTLLGGNHKASGIPHVQVCYNGEMVHDPLPNGCELDPKEVWLFCVLDPSKQKAIKSLLIA